MKKNTSFQIYFLLYCVYNAFSPALGANTSQDRRQDSTRCKVFPGDADWPSEQQWKSLNSSLSGVLLRPRLAASVCYRGANFNQTQCQFLVSGTSSTRFWLDDPLTELAQWTQGSTCVASLTAVGNCTRGGFPEYVVNATASGHVQAAVNFARENNIRLVIKNTGHDFGGRSVGAGSLSVWTHYLKSTEFIPEYQIGNYSGMAVRLGAGVEAWEVSNLMAAHNATVVAAGCNTVGGTGGWLSSGGHSTVTSTFGLGADQALSIDVVTADGALVTADPFRNEDLFWAVRGGGGSTYGILVSVVMKAYPPISISSSSLSLTVSNATTPGTIRDADTFWQGVGAYYRFAAHILDAGGYGFSYIYPMANNTYRFTTSSSFPGMSPTTAFNFMQPLYNSLQDLGINVTNPTIASAHPYGSPRSGTGDRPVNTRYRSRLLPRENWEDDALFDDTMAAIRTCVEGGFENDFYFHGTLTSPTEEVAGWPGSNSAVLPAWRKNRMHAMLMDVQPDGLTAEQAVDRDSLMQGYMSLLREVSPDAGSYMNEGDVGEPNWQQAFFGENYDRLLEIKNTWDPLQVFWAPTTVGSEGWQVQPVDGYPHSQNGRLCRVE
ncbi:FAD-binding domain-containing protein [Xylariaceae sp. FL1019]|nr:FAD-binding domain-containing protein [Xylariaceae sp. FL1019]